MTEEQINHLQSLLDAGTQGEWRFDGREVVVEHKFPRVSRVAVTVNSEDSDLLVELHNVAPALLEAARENLRLREAINLILKKVVGTQALIENEATDEALSTVEFCLQDIWTVITHPHLVRELNQKETV